MTDLTLRTWSLALAILLVGATACEELGDSDPCDPGCHWDCFGGVQCEAGEVHLLGFGARECCHYGEPWPDPGPVCSAGVGYRCQEGCAAADPRYAYCAEALELDMTVLPDEDSLLRLLCVEGGPKQEGDSCIDDDDCRPADHLDDRLVCDLGLGACVRALRPDPAPGVGDSCGLDAADLLPVDEALAPAGDCDLCYFRYESGDTCVYQACTQLCRYDEDCPVGMDCVCITDGFDNRSTRFCAPATADRTTPEGRTAGLPCR